MDGLRHLLLLLPVLSVECGEGSRGGLGKGGEARWISNPVTRCSVIPDRLQISGHPPQHKEGLSPLNCVRFLQPGQAGVGGADRTSFRGPRPDAARRGPSRRIFTPPPPPPELASVVCERSEVRSARRSRPRPLRAPAAAGGTEGGPQCVWPGPFYFPPITHASARAFLPEIEGTTPTGQLGGAAPVHPHGATCRATTREAGTRTFPVGTCTASPPTPPRRSPREGWTWWTSRSWRRRAPRLPSAAASRAPRSRSATAPTAGTTPSAATTRAR